MDVKEALGPYFQKKLRIIACCKMVNPKHVQIQLLVNGVDYIGASSKCSKGGMKCCLERGGCC